MVRTFKATNLTSQGPFWEIPKHEVAVDVANLAL